MADEPMPASQANTMSWIGPVLAAGLGVGERASDAIDFLPFIASIWLRWRPAGRRPRRPVHLQQERPDQEGHQRRAEHTQGDPEEVPPGRLRVDREDRARGRRSAQPDVEQHEQEDAGHATGDRGEDQLGLHQHVREVDLVDAAEELDDQRARGRGLGQALAEERVGQQQAQAGAGVGLEQEQHRLALLRGLLDAERRQHAVVDGVVEEEHLRRLDEDRGQRQQAVVDQGLDRLAEPVGDLSAGSGRGGTCRATAITRGQDAGGEVVDQHLEAGLDLVGSTARRAASSPAR